MSVNAYRFRSWGDDSSLIVGLGTRRFCHIGQRPQPHNQTQMQMPPDLPALGATF
jgi:hypothetical protein